MLCRESKIGKQQYNDPDITDFAIFFFFLNWKILVACLVELLEFGILYLVFKTNKKSFVQFVRESMWQVEKRVAGIHSNKYVQLEV